ncbi:glycosyltransferase family 9 protein [Marinospirillum sp. MEB164]|uniref:Glycosyltransferase family 9 protein n=1 Tax=Marinospirillum alkalitolerans TaxID=3123374 RepID=A0ABW8PVQ7_9GAMM
MPASQSASLGDVCVLRLSALGDVCNLVPSLRALQAAAPATRITWVIGRAEYSLLEGLEGIELLVYDKSSGLKGMRALRQQLLEQRQGRPFDLLLHMQAALRASVLSRFIPAQRRIGFDSARAKDYQGWFVNEQIAPHPRAHVGEGFLDFVRHLGCPLSQPEWRLPLPDAAREAAQALRPHSSYLLLSPCSSQRARNWRNWSLEGYAALADYAWQRYGLATVISGGNTPMEQDAAAKISAWSQAPITNLVGKTSLKVLLALIEQARCVVAPDSGPIHMAAALGTPPLGLYVTSNPERTGPWRGREYVVNAYPQAVRQFLGKEEDQVGWGQRVRDPDAIDLITQEAVFAALDRVMAGPARLD